LQQLVNNMLQGPLQTQLQQLPVVPSVFDASGAGLGDAFIYLSKAETTDSHALIYAKLFFKTGSGNNPPDTSFAQAMDSCKPGLLNVRAAGSDDDTPAQLLQYRFRIDDGPWSEPSYSPNYAALLQSTGKHVIEVAAIDLDGNVDPSPARRRGTRCRSTSPPPALAPAPRPTPAPAAVRRIRTAPAQRPRPRTTPALWLRATAPPAPPARRRSPAAVSCRARRRAPSSCWSCCCSPGSRCADAAGRTQAERSGFAPPHAQRQLVRWLI
jgi:hypothetical protein